MGSRKRKPSSRLCRMCRRKTRHGSGTCLSHRTEGPMPLYFARLKAAEAICQEVYDYTMDGDNPVMDALLAAWRKAKEASER